MAFNVKKSDGSTLVIVSSNSVDTTASSITLHGRGRLQWGNAVNENFVHLLENFADGSPPSNPLVGQLWFDKTSIVGSPIGLGVLKFWTQTGSPTTGQWIPLANDFGGGYVLKTGDTMSGNLQFVIPSAGSPENESSGIVWSGNTDQVRMFVSEGTGSPNNVSSFIIEIEDDANQDHLRIRHKSSNGSQDTIVCRDSNTTIRGTSDNVLNLRTDSLSPGVFNPNATGYGYIQYWTRDDSFLTPTATIGFTDFNVNIAGKKQFTIDNTAPSGSGSPVQLKAFEYRENGQLAFKVSGGSEGINPTVDNYGGGIAFYRPAYSGSPAYNEKPSFSIGFGGFDLVLGAHDTVTRGDTGSSRAVVKDSGGTLTLNYGSDFSGVRVGSNNTSQRSDLEVTGEIKIATYEPTASVGNGLIYLTCDAANNDIQLGSDNASILELSFYNRTAASLMDINARKGSFQGTGGIALAVNSQRITSVAAPTANTDAVNARYSLGHLGYSWYDFTASRSASTTYTNSNGRPIAVNIRATFTIGAGTVRLAIAPSGTPTNMIGSAGIDEEEPSEFNVVGVVPPGYKYRVTTSGTGSINKWYEML